MNSEMYEKNFSSDVAKFYASQNIKTVEQLKNHPHYYSYGFYNDEDDVFGKLLSELKDYENYVKDRLSSVDYEKDCDTYYAFGAGFFNFGVDGEFYSYVEDDGNIVFLCCYAPGWIEDNYWGNHYFDNYDNSFEIDIHSQTIRKDVENGLCEACLRLFELCEQGYFDNLE